MSKNIGGDIFMNGFIKYFISRLPEIGILLNQYIKISGIAVLIATFIGVPVGILIKSI